MFEVMVFALPSNCYVLWSPAFQEVAEHLTADGKHWMESLFCFACGRIFVSLIKLSLRNVTHFLISVFLILPLNPLQGGDLPASRDQSTTPGTAN